MDLSISSALTCAINTELMGCDYVTESFNQVEEGVFIGSIESVHPQFLIDHHIGLIVKCTQDKILPFIDPKIVHEIPVDDHPHFKITEHLEPAILAINQTLLASKNVLVHCELGISRSSSVVAAYLMDKYNENYPKAMQRLKSKHSKACPAPWFKEELIGFSVGLRMKKAAKDQMTVLPAKLSWDEFKSIKGKGIIDQGEILGLWGNSSAGVLICNDDPLTKFLLFKRSKEVDSPGVWSIPGGARKVLNGSNDLENPIETALDELREEAKCLPRGDLYTRPIVYLSEGRDYSTFLLKASFWEHYQPALNWEHSEFKWMTRDEALAEKLHDGLRYVLSLNGLFDRFAD